MWTRKENFLELWKWFYCLALSMVCSLTACAGGIQQVTPAGMCLLMVPSCHKNIWSYFSFSLLFLTWRCQTNAGCFGQGTVFCVRGGHRKGCIGMRYVICDKDLWHMPLDLQLCFVCQCHGNGREMGWEIWREHLVGIWPYLFLGDVCMCLFILWIITSMQSRRTRSIGDSSALDFCLFFIGFFRLVLWPNTAWIL